MYINSSTSQILPLFYTNTQTASEGTQTQQDLPDTYNMLLILLCTFLFTTLTTAAKLDWRAIESNDSDIHIISDVDDILRVTELWSPSRAIKNAFTDPFTAVRDMPQLYHEWEATSPLHFSYVSDAPDLFNKTYVHGLKKQYVFSPLRCLLSCLKRSCGAQPTCV